MIKSLSKDVQARLRSGVAVFSLQQCVEELLLNSIDAGATCVAVKIDIEACKVQVIDNGLGMDRENMERVGMRYCTSKCSSLEDLENLRFYGFRGEAIASMATLATLVEISSRTRTSVKTFVKRFHEGKASEVFEAQTTRPSAGTTVLICNFFYNMPVRRKRMDSVQEVERLRQRVEAMSLVHPSVSFTMKKDCAGTLLVQLPKARNTYYRFVQIHGLGRAKKLGEVNYTYGQFEMTGHVGREGHYNNSLQFLFVNSRLLLKTRIHKLLNCLLRRLSSASVQTNNPNAAISSPKQRGAADLHGVYVINIKCHYSEYDVCLEPAKSLIEFKDWDSVLFCVEEGVKAFLTKENLVSECSVGDMQNFGSAFSNQESGPGGNAKTSTSDICQRNVEDVFKDTGSSALAETTDVKQDQEVQSAEEVLESVLSHTESKAGSDSDPEKEIVKDDAVDKLLPTTSVSVRQTENDQNAQSTDMNDNDLALHVNHRKITPCENSRIAIIGHKETYDSLRRFTEPNLGCEPKRKLSLLHAKSHMDDCDHGPKIARVTPRCKLTMSFETGSLDKFKRMFGKGVETEHQTKNAQITDVLCPTFSLDSCAVAALDASSNSFCTENMQVEDVRVDGSSLKDNSLTLPAYEKLKCSTSACKRNRISLAAKLSHRVDGKKPYEVEPEDTKKEDTLINKTLPNPVTQDTNYIESFTDSVSHHGAVENNDGFSNDSVLVENSATTEPLEDDRSDQPTFIAPNGQDTSTTTSTTGETEHTKNTTSPKPDSPPGQIVNPASQHDLLPSKTRNEEQTANESQGHESDGTKPVSSDWLAHYDDLLGKLVYINQATGLSKYDHSSLEETRVPCSTNITNMAVSVVSKTGFEYRCYPFQTDLVLPFLPKARAERVCSSRIENADQVEGPSALSTLYSKWSNPVFVRPPQVAVDVTSGQAEGLAVKIHNILFPYRFTKDMIHSMEVIHQVDKKFLACLINTSGQNTTGTSESEGNLLVLVDQHAAHERVRLEGLVTESYEDDPDTPGKKRLCSSCVSPPLEINVTEEEIRLMRLYQPSLRDLALEISFPRTAQSYVLVEQLPTCFIEKENTEKRRGRRSVIKSIAEEYLREHIESLQSTGIVKGTLPLTVHNVLASQACHGAIKFNDGLSKGECCSLVASLSSCQLPFQCAHGRPSILPLADLLHLEDEQDLPKPNLRKLRRMYKAWQLYGKN